MKEMMQVTQEINRRYLQAFNASGCQVLICNLSGASTSIVSPVFFREWVLPELRWLVAHAGAGKYIGFHLTGKMRDVLPIMMEASPHFVLRFESPRFGGDVTLREAKERYGNRVCLMGGYDPHIFCSGSLEEIKNEAIRCIDEAAVGGGYILDNTDAVPEEARMEDVRAMVETAKAYGRYSGGAGRLEMRRVSAH
jgi:uroporphyrinogen-III decarboxylase